MDIDSIKQATALYENTVDTALKQYNEIVAQAEAQFKQHVNESLKLRGGSVSDSTDVDAMRSELLNIQSILGSLQKEVHNK